MTKPWSSAVKNDGLRPVAEAAWEHLRVTR